MVPRFCRAPLPFFNTSLTAPFELGTGLFIRPRGEDLAALLREYERRTTDPPDYRALDSDDLRLVERSEWIVALDDEVPDDRAINSNHRDSMDLVNTALHVMQLVQPTVPSRGCVLGGFIRNGEMELTVYGKPLPPTPLTDSQRLGRFDQVHGDQVRTILPRAIQALKAHGRLATALRTYSMALRSREFEPKIVLGTTVFEALFSSSEKEISYSLRANMACWLGTTEEERRRIWEDVRRIYGVRSAVVHGADWRNKFRGTDEERAVAIGRMVEDVDGYIRRVMVKILSDDATFQVFMSHNTLESYWQEVLLRR